MAAQGAPRGTAAESARGHTAVGGLAREARRAIGRHIARIGEADTRSDADHYARAAVTARRSEVGKLVEARVDGAALALVQSRRRAARQLKDWKVLTGR